MTAWTAFGVGATICSGVGVEILGGGRFKLGGPRLGMGGSLVKVGGPTSCMSGIETVGGMGMGMDMEVVVWARVF